MNLVFLQEIKKNSQKAIKNEGLFLSKDNIKEDILNEGIIFHDFPYSRGKPHSQSS